MRKAKEPPSFSHYLDKLRADQPLELVLVGHLVVEALLVDAIQLKVSGDKPWKWNFPTKLQFCVDQGIIPAARQALYLKLNDIRNDFAHSLGHKLTFDDAFDYVNDMAKAGYDFSDETIFKDKKLSDEWYGVEGIFKEILTEFYSELAWFLDSKGGPDRLVG